MPIGLGASLGIGGGRSSTSSGAAGGGVTPSPFNVFSGSFDGANDRLSVPKAINAPLSSSAWSISVWMYPDTAVSYDYLFSNGIPVQLAYHGGKIKAFLSVGAGYFANVASTASPPTGAWTHVVAVFTTTSLKFYLDGSLDSTHTYSSNTCGDPGTDAAIGSYTSGSVPFDGLLEELAVFNTSLSDANVTTIWNSGAPASLTALDPVGWWRMGDSVGDVNTSGGAPADAGAIGTIVNAATGAASLGTAVNATGVNGAAFSTTVPT